MGSTRDRKASKAKAPRTAGWTSRGGAALALSLAAHGVLAGLLFLLPVTATDLQDRQRIPLRMIDRLPRVAVLEAADPRVAPEPEGASPDPIAAVPGPRPRRVEPVLDPPPDEEKAPRPAPRDEAPSPGPAAADGTEGTGAGPGPAGQAAGGGGEGTDTQVAGTGGDTAPSGGAGRPGTGTGDGIGGSGGPSRTADALDRYVIEVQRRFDAVKRLPESARRKERDGLVVLKVRIEADGRVASTSIESPSDWPELDRAALATASRVGDLPPPPAGNREFLVPIRFSLNRW